MNRYADPLQCPDCRRAHNGAPTCPHCGLPLRGAMVNDLFQTLLRADSLVAELRATVSGRPVTGVAPATPAPAPAPRGDVPVQLPPPLPPATGAARGRSGGMSVASVLLGLGALCLLVAALVFIAVAWSAMGVGGRTATLLVITASAGAVTVWTARRGLRGAAEALSAVTLGLVAIDIAGMDSAGWFDGLSDGAMPLGWGLAWVLAGLAFAGLVAVRDSARRLVAPQVVAALGLVAALIGFITWFDLELAPSFVVGIGLGAALGAAAHLLRQRVAAIGGLGFAALSWLAVTLTGITKVLSDPSVARLWGDLQAWPLLVSIAVAAAAAAAPRLPLWCRVALVSAAGGLATFLALGALYDDPDPLVGTAAALLVALAALAAVLRLRSADPWPWAPLPGVALTGAIAGLGALVLAVTALDNIVPDRAWSVTAGDSLGSPDPVLHPVLLPVTAIAGCLAVLLLAAALPRTRPAPARLVRLAAPALVVVAALTATATLSLYDVPRAVPVVLLSALAAAATAWGLRADTWVLIAVPTPALVLALVAAIASQTLTALVLAVACLVVLAVHGLATHVFARDFAAITFPPVLAGLVFTLFDLAGMDPLVTVAVVIGVVGLLAVTQARMIVELSVGFTAVVAMIAAADQPGMSQSWLALYLTVAGTAVTASALLNRSRRPGTYAGWALLSLASWLRLDAVGVEVVEAYTLPSAAVLLLAGLWDLHTRRAGTLLTLAPGLGLALLPSLAAVLDDPVSLRALLLGLACLVLVGIGTSIRWAAPLVAGGFVGALLVLVEAASAQVLPQWVLIGIVGVLLTVAGVTWEQRLRELRSAVGYVRGLR